MFSKNIKNQQKCMLTAYSEVEKQSQAYIHQVANSVKISIVYIYMYVCVLRQWFEYWRFKLL